MSDQERKLYDEAKQREDFPPLNFDMRVDSVEKLAELFDEIGWRAWQARAALAQQAVPEALKAATAAIYFADSADYLPALWDVVRTLSPEIAELAERDARAAWEKADALAAAPAAHQAEQQADDLPTEEHIRELADEAREIAAKVTGDRADGDDPCCYGGPREACGIPCARHRAKQSTQAPAVGDEK